MKKYFINLLVLGCVLCYSCNNPKKEKNENVKDEKSNVADSAIQNTDAKSTIVEENKIKTLKTKFEKIIATSDGVIFIFSDESDKEIEFYTVKKENGGGGAIPSGMEFTRNMMPDKIYPEYENKWFELEYKKLMKEFFDGGLNETVKREVPVIISLKELETPEVKSKHSAVKEKLLNALFLGVEPNWTFEFNESSAEFTLMGESPKKFFYHSKKSNNLEAIPLAKAIQKVSAKEIKIKAKDENNIVVFITVKEEPCNDGMSDNSYPYSIILDYIEGTDYSGCGRIK